MKPTTVKTDPVLEAMACKLSGIETVPLAEKMKMVKRAAKAGRDATRAENTKLTEELGKLDEAVRELMPFVLEDYYHECALPRYRKAVEKIRVLIKQKKARQAMSKGSKQRPYNQQKWDDGYDRAFSVSTCCGVGYKTKVEYWAETDFAGETNYYVCNKCGQACDLKPRDGK